MEQIPKKQENTNPHPTPEEKAISSNKQDQRIKDAITETSYITPFLTLIEKLSLNLTERDLSFHLKNWSDFKKRRSLQIAKNETT